MRVLIVVCPSFLRDRRFAVQAGGRPPRCAPRVILGEEVSEYGFRLGGVHFRWIQGPLTVPDHEGSKSQL